jgi:hypothetical protein
LRQLYPTAGLLDLPVREGTAVSRRHPKEEIEMAQFEAKPQSDLVNRKAIAIFNPADLDTELGARRFTPRCTFFATSMGFRAPLRIAPISPLAV